MVSDRLQKLLSSLDWSQARLAEEIKTYKPTVNRWMTGKIKPSRRNLVKISRATGCSLYWLQDGQGDMFSKSPSWLANFDRSKEQPPSWLTEDLAPLTESRREEWLAGEGNRAMLKKAEAVLASDDDDGRVVLATTINYLYEKVATSGEKVGRGEEKTTKKGLRNKP